MIVRSRFTFWAYFLIIVSLFLLVISLVLISLLFESPSMGTILVVTIGLLCNLFFIAWLVWGELRTKTIKFSMGLDEVTVKGFIGLGNEKTFPLFELTGFKTAMLPSKFRDYEYLYLMIGDQKVIKLSEFYHKNYSVLKKEISGKLNDLGFDKFRLSKELKEIFK